MTKETFWNYVEKTEHCWNWKGFRDKDGYGRLKFNGKLRSAHRLSAEWSGILNAKVIMHSCDNPACVNPEHLKGGTQTENRKDCVDKGRTAKGEQQGQAKLTENDVEFIKAITHPHKKIAKWFGISQATIWYIKNGRAWKHVR